MPLMSTVRFLALLAIGWTLRVTMAQGVTSGQITTLPMPFAWPGEGFPIAADVIAVDGQQKTFVIHSGVGRPMSFSGNGLAGTLTYILGPSTLSVNYVATESPLVPGAGGALTGLASCTFTPASALASPATCSINIGGQATTQVNTLTAARVTIGTIEGTIFTIQTSLPPSPVPSPPLTGTPVPTPTIGLSSSGGGSITSISDSSSGGPAPTGSASRPIMLSPAALALAFISLVLAL